MISREWTESAIAAGFEEWQRGREADPTLAPGGVPDLQEVTGFSLDDLRYNCVGRQSPAQQRQGYKGIVAQLIGIAFGGAWAAYALHHGSWLIPIMVLPFVAFAAYKTLVDLEATSAGLVSQVDGDISTEIQRDSEGPDLYFVNVEGMSLGISRQAYEALVAGGPYRIYFVNGRAVGGQVLPGWRPAPPAEDKKKSWWG